MTVDHYAGAARRWAEGATLVYGPIARDLVALTKHPLAGRLVLDVGAGTGVASDVLGAHGARVVAADLSADMLAWRASDRPAALVAEITRLPLPSASVDDVVAAFVLNHLPDPLPGLAELTRVTRSGGGVLACVWSSAARNEARDTLDDTARSLGWTPPQWYLELKERWAPALGNAEDMAEMAARAGLTGVQVREHPVDVDVTRAEQLVEYRLGQAQFASWLDSLEPGRASEIRALIVTSVQPVMTPYCPPVVFLSALVA
jgi:SAM-dependent methyltransferase